MSPEHKTCSDLLVIAVSMKGNCNQHMRIIHMSYYIKQLMLIHLSHRIINENY